MSPVLCPQGHASEATDWCDVCGSPIAPQAPVVPAGQPVTPPPSAAPVPCPNCGTVASAGALFCENCGYDFTTGALPVATSTTTAPAPTTGSVPVAAVPVPAPADAWVVEIWVDPDWYAVQKPEDAMPSAGPPALVPLRERSVLVGRPSVSRNIHPKVDCGADSGVSRRHCQLYSDGQRWWVEDLQSSNGTFVARAGDPIPVDPIPAGQRRELEDGDRIYLGAWTRLVVRRALPGEV